jgi:hypothetical protein
MSNVHVVTTAKETKWSPYARANYERVLRAAKHDSKRKHILVDSPDEADLIIFVEANSPFHVDILRTNLYKTFSDKCFVFDSQDYALPSIPGLYMCVPPHLTELPIYEYGFYIRVFDNSMLDGSIPDAQFLFSFIGKVGNCDKLRRRVIGLNHPRSFLADSSSNQADNDLEYVRIMKQSKFVVCPRGFGPSTWRCFEAMKAGRVPVVVSDNWSPPPGLNWNDFSIRIPEAEVDTIPSVLEAIEHLAGEMGCRARQAWHDNFALDRSFHYLVERCLEIQPFIKSCEKVVRRNRLTEVSKPHVSRFIKDNLRMVIDNRPFIPA